MPVVRLLAFVLLVGCGHKEGCDGNYAERYARALDPTVECTTIRYGEGSTPTDHALCKNGRETWYCSTEPDGCWVLVPVRYMRDPASVPPQMPERPTQ